MFINVYGVANAIALKNTNLLKLVRQQSFTIFGEKTGKMKNLLMGYTKANHVQTVENS